MLLNEHKSKILFEKVHIPTPEGIPLFPGEENGFTPTFPPMDFQVASPGRRPGQRAEFFE